MKFIKSLSFLLLFCTSGLSLQASVWMSWFDSLPSPTSASVVAKITVPLSSLTFNTNTQGMGWMQWLDDKVTFTIKPISGLGKMGKAIYNGQGWSAAALIGAFFGGYYLNKNFKCWWNTQSEERRKINNIIKDDLKKKDQNSKDAALEHANKCQTIYFTKDQQLINLVTDFYTFRNTGNNKWNKKTELKEKAERIYTRLWGKFKNC